ncbi:hypothetical protein [Frankia sp. CiP3]|uniref:DUF7662 domain-containing protein n=1 Tax=Frankia sp. CiP3 TaxID=2880971 RepID=UPI001EF5441D|nr:hypothetical protein [Frankia sp. CiP3]
MSRYDPLTAYLRVAADHGQATVELGFDQIEEIIGSSLPASSDQRQWWANSSHSQALAWRAAGFHVEQVYLDRQRVRFARGTRGGSYADHGRIAMSPAPRRTAPPLVDRQPVGAAVDVRVRLRWLDAGVITLDPSGKPTFGGLEGAPGLYRMTLTGAAADIRPQVYIGETDSLRAGCPSTTAAQEPDSRQACGSTPCCARTSLPADVSTSLWQRRRPCGSMASSSPST